MTLLIIYQSKDFDKSLTDSLDNQAGKELFNRLKILFEKTMAAELFWLDDYHTLYYDHNTIDFSDLPDDVFMQVYVLLQADNDLLKPYQDEVKQKMQTDRRFI